MPPVRYKIKRHMRFKTATRSYIREYFRHNLREFVLVSAALVAAGAYIITHEQAHGAVEITSESVMPHPYISPLDHSPSQARVMHTDPKMMGSYTTTVDLRYMSLKGNEAHMGASYSALMGVQYDKKNKGLVPMEVKINWAQALQHQWAMKLQRDDVSPATRKWAAHVVQNYANSPRDTKGIKTFVNEANNAATEMNRKIDYDALCHDFRLKSCVYYRTTVNKIHGKNIVAYGMTELFPSHVGEFNYVILDTILRNAGENYLDAIPSGGDSLLSKGLYQFTSLAIRRDDSGLLGGVTYIDNHAGMKLSGSVVHLKEQDAHKAAFEFAVYNIGQMMRSMSDHDAKILATKCPVEGLTELIAVSHHQPSRAWESGKHWVHAGCSKPLQSYLNKPLREYALKTEVNFSALNNHI